mmetsp:Transcript_27763/g.88387  ORF Transcript_27763/g.88387 Transcript_27763/m.88387 type:complete len:228 (+) Transcript_27763:317-1000(+)
MLLQRRHRWACRARAGSPSAPASRTWCVHCRSSAMRLTPAASCSCAQFRPRSKGDRGREPAWPRRRRSSCAPRRPRRATASPRGAAAGPALSPAAGSLLAARRRPRSSLSTATVARQSWRISTRCFWRPTTDRQATSTRTRAPAGPGAGHRGSGWRMMDWRLCWRGSRESISTTTLRTTSISIWEISTRGKRRYRGVRPAGGRAPTWRWAAVGSRRFWGRKRAWAAC